MTRMLMMFLVSWSLTVVLRLVMGTLTCKSCVLFPNDRGVTADCSHRNLTTIPDDLPRNVTTLLLSHNNISNLSSAFSDLHRLRHLDISNNNLHQLQTKAFTNLSFLENLSLEGNSLPLNSNGYPSDIFYGLNHLRCLRLNNNVKDAEGMEYPGKQLSALLSLEELYIDGLPKGRFGPEFKVLTALTNLTMSGRTGYCVITNITVDYFKYLKKLRLLNMTKCNVQYIDRNAFAGLTNITTFDISSNDDLGIDNVSFMLYGLQNSTLETLYANGIERRSASCVRVPKTLGLYLRNTPLKEIYLDNNYIVTAETGTLAALPKSLEVLSVRNSRLVYGHYFFELLTMSNLRKIDLSELRVGHVLPDSLWRRNSTVNQNFVFALPPKLEEFYSEDGTFRVAFNNVNFSSNHLKKLSYRHNVITKWKGPMYGVDQLEELDLSENFCDHASTGCLKGFYNLKILRANSNYLGSFLKNDTNGQVFGHSNNLTFLDLSLNKIDDLPVNVFRSQDKLQTLNLSRNSISDIKVNISHMTNLTLLNLKSNQIASLSNVFVNQLNTIRKHSGLRVDLSDNPILCSCDTLWFVRWMVLQKDMFENRHFYVCSPQSGWMNGKNVFDIVVDLENVCTSHLGLAMGLVAAVTVVVCIVIGAITFRYRWKLRYLYYVARGRYRGHSIIQHGDREYEYDAFVSYADEDRQFALHTFINKLEQEGNIRLCLHHRDFLPGESIAANILSAIQNSRRVVVVLSPNFLDSYWCRWEFEMARMESLYTERNMVVLVKYQEVIPRLVPRDMMYMMHTKTYLEFPQDMDDQDTFWTALRHAISAS